MEETIRKLKQFIEQIAIAETEADVYRIQLFVTPGARRKVFQMIDREQAGVIVHDDLCWFCGELGLGVSEEDSEIIGRYFRNWHKGITFDQFSQILQPKSLLSHPQPPQSTQPPQKIFLNLIKTVLSSYQQLQHLRQALSTKSTEIIHHFQDCYQSGHGFSKDCLKSFMVNQDLYSKRKFLAVSGYVFGEVEGWIPWGSFFGNGGEGMEGVDGEVRDCGEYVEDIQPQKIEKTTEENQSKIKLPKSCKNIEEVLNQIQQIQKNLKQKKQKQHQPKPTSPQPQPQPQPQKRPPLAGKVVSRNRNSHQQQSQQQTLIKPVTFIKQAQKYNIPSSYMDKPQQRSKQLSYNSSVRNLKKCASEAQMKIDQIQRRAMDKYLNARRNDYLPADTYIPYYHDTRENYQFGRLRNLEHYEPGRIANVLSRRTSSNFHLYTRNNVSRAWLYDNNEMTHFTRPVSPRLLRY